MPPHFHRIAVLGTGLIGGSFALAARAALPGLRVAGWDKPAVLERALARGVVDEAYSDLPGAVKGAELIYVALPVGVAIECLPEIARHAVPGAVVTDACSTKRAICGTAEKCFVGGARFVGGHPMAGSEVSGVEGADATLFRGAKYALISGAVSGSAGGSGTPAEGADARAANLVSLIEAMGARPIWLDAATHDRAAAFVSHLPQLAAIALASVAREATDQTGLPLTLAGRGFRDALRLAGSPYSVWRDIVLTNTDNLDAALDRLAQAIEHLRAHLRERQLEEEFAAANDVYKVLRNLGSM
jgi:prephenate dehydrogenase